MHPYLTEQLATNHRQELLRAAQRSSKVTLPERGKAPRTARQRAGWVLIEIGLRLAGTTSDA